MFKAASPQWTNWTRFQSFVGSFYCIESIDTNLHHESNMAMWLYGLFKRKGLCKLSVHLCTIDNSYACKWLTLLISSFQPVLQLFAMFLSVSACLGYEGVSFWRPLRILRCRKGWQKETWRIKHEHWRQWSLNWADFFLSREPYQPPLSTVTVLGQDPTCISYQTLQDVIFSDVPQQERMPLLGWVVTGRNRLFSYVPKLFIEKLYGSRHLLVLPGSLGGWSSLTICLNGLQVLF